MPNSTVRQGRLFEIEVADYLGWTSVGGPGNPDLISDDFVGECKLYKQTSTDTLMQKAESFQTKGRIPVVIIKKKGLHLRNAVVLIRLSTFAEILKRLKLVDRILEMVDENLLLQDKPDT